MRQRDRLEVARYHDEIAAIERAEQERVNAPILAAEKALQETHRQLRALEAEKVTKQKDENVYLSPEMKSATMPREEADAFNKQQAELFVAQSPWYAPYRTDANAEVIVEYLKRNSVQIHDIATIRAAVIRLRDLGLLTEITAPEPELPVHDTPAPSPAQPEMYDGFDIDGLPCTFTKRQVDRMSADEYRRAFLVSSESLRLPRVGPGPKGLL